MPSNIPTTQLTPTSRYLKFGAEDTLLCPKIAMTILMFDMSNFRKFLCLSPNWHHLVIEGMDEYFKPVEIDFVMKNYEYLLFKKSYTNSSIIHYGGRKGVRVDRVLVCEVLPTSKSQNKCMKAKYKYRYTNAKSEKEVFAAEYKMDIIKSKQNKVVWIHKDEQEQMSMKRSIQNFREGQDE